MLVALAGSGWWLTQPVQAAEPTGRRFAFLVGVTQYNHSLLDDLKHCDSDITDLAALLERGGFDGVYRLTSKTGDRESSTQQADPKRRPEAETIRKQLRAWLRQWKVTKDDLILVGLSGHGVQPRGSQEAYFCPQDANPVMQTVAGGEAQEPVRPQSLVGLSSDLLEILTESGIGYRLLLVDACRNSLRKSPDKGGKGALTGLDAVPFTLPGTEQVQTALLLSCSKGEQSYEDEQFGGGHGAFFHQVLRGLEQGLAVDGEQNVTLNSLENHITQQTPDVVEQVLSQKQNPNVLKNVRGRPRVLLSKAEVSRLRKGGDLPREVPTMRSVATIEGTKAGEERDDNGLKMKFVWCPPGQFTMGSPKSEEGRDSDEDQVQVRLTKGFWIGKYEVTQGEWERVMGTTPWKGQDNLKEGSRYAATYVSWEDATEFVAKLTTQERQAGRLPVGSRYTLPTEAQWEYACRAGTQTAFGFGGDASRLSEYAWWGGIFGDGNAKTEQYAHEVGLKKANAWGLHDVHGNVWEWCRDWKDDKLPGGVDPEQTKQASSRVFRGGSWFYHAVFCRSAVRYFDVPGFRNYNLGFRVVRSSEP
jgi:formylglycine-generating enzyme required for sulfatase activity